MRKIKNHNLAQLLMQLRFNPARQRRKQLDAAEKLLSLIDKNKQYPFEFVCFHITDFRPSGPQGRQLINGAELAEDLPIFISKLSSQVAPYLSEQKQKVYTIGQLADQFGVSTKTIHRWRKKGLIARKFIFDDDIKRFGFLQSSVDKFIAENSELVAKAKSFTRLTNKQKRLIIKRVAELVAKTDMSRYQIIEKIASQTGKAHETIRYILLNYEKSNPDKAVFEKPSGVVSPAAEAEIYNLFRQGRSVKELMARFHRTKSSIYRIINQRRARLLLSEKIEFIISDEFLEEDAKNKIIAKSISAAKPLARKGNELLKLADNSLHQYLQLLKDATVLDREREVELFRRYNFLKYLASINQAGIKPTGVFSTKLSEIEGYLAQAEIIKKMIIEANLQLVVGIARKHTISGANLADLVSEGNFSLMRAVEKFDYTKGFRFATYASWAIAKDYARKIPAETARPDKATAASMAHIHRDMRTTSAGVEAVERAHRSLAEVIKDNLDQREQYIIINHFGLVGTLIRKEKKTLKQIGDELGLSKERVRQIELIALQKLRHSLSIEEFELLTG